MVTHNLNLSDPALDGPFHPYAMHASVSYPVAYIVSSSNKMTFPIYKSIS